MRKKLYYQRALQEGIAGNGPLFPERKRQSRKQPRYLIPSGTTCGIRRVEEQKEEWREYNTKQDIWFERYERYETTETGNFYHFRESGWLMVVHRRFVIHREDGYEAAAVVRG